MEFLGFASAPLCFAAFAAAALSMDRHHRQVTGQACPAPLRGHLRALSAALLLLAALLAMVGGGISFVTGVLGAGLAAGAVVGLLNLRPQLLRWLLPNGAAMR